MRLKGNWIVITLLAMAVLTGACADLTMDDALSIYEEFRPTADPCRIPDSVECASAGVVEEIDKESEAEDLRSAAVAAMDDDPEEARDAISEAIELRPLDPAHRRVRMIIDVAGGRQPAAIDLLVFGRDKDPVYVQMELASAYVFAANSTYKDEPMERSNVTQAFCALMEQFKASGSLNTRPEDQRDSVESLWAYASDLCSLSR